MAPAARPVRQDRQVLPAVTFVLEEFSAVEWVMVIIVLHPPPG